MSEQDVRLSSTKQRRKAHWQKQGNLWRTEPEIDAKRQAYLANQRNNTPDIKQGFYPFKDIKLSRADIEWLLATHENREGPIDWDERDERVRIGLNLIGANLQGQDLHELPLAEAGVHLEGADLSGAHLEGAHLSNAYLM